MSRRPLRRARAVVVALLIGILSLGAAPTVAAAVVPSSVATPVVSGSISGTVTDPAGAASVDAVVSVIGADGRTVSDAKTGSQGGYTVADLPAGTYFVSVVEEGSAPVFWPDAETATNAQAVTVAEGSAVVGIDMETRPAETPVTPAEPPSPGAAASTFALSPSPAPEATTYTLSGYVTGDGGAPIQAAMVFVSGGSTWTYKSAQTDAHGAYSVSGLPAGEYVVQASVFMGSYTDQRVTLDIAADSRHDFALVRGATISGTVVGGQASDVDVELLREDDLEMEAWASGTGTFQFQRVPAGRYILLAIPRRGTEAAAFYPGVTDPHDATVITVEGEQTVTDLDWGLMPGRTISGTIGNMPGTSAHVSATAAAWDWKGAKVYPYWNDVYGTAGADGRYALSGATDGDYTVRANTYEPAEPGGSSIVWEGYYGDTPLSDDAENVSVRGADVEDIDFPLFGQGAASGVIRAEGGTAPLENTLITAYRWNGATWDQTLAVSGWGRYSLGLHVSEVSYGLPEGTYTIGFSDPDNEWVDDGVDYPYCPQFWSGKATIEDADRFQIVPGKDTPGVNATLRLKSNGCASETITPGSPVIQGAPRVGDSLTADPGSWAPEPVQLAYQWRADGKDIDGATSAIFTPTAAQAGTKLTVAVTGSRPGYESVTAVSPDSSVVAAVDSVLQAGEPVLSGPALSGVPITVDPGAWEPEPVEFAYQWSVDGLPIEGATGPTYTPTTAQVGARLSVTIVGSKPGYTSVSTEVNAGTISASIALDSSSALPGGAIVVTGTGYEPGETVRVELHSVVRQLGTAVADAEGVFRLPTTVPLDAVPGDHSVLGIGESSGRIAQAPITVGSPSATGGSIPSTPAPAPSALAVTGTTVPIALAAFGILLVGGGLLVRRPARRRT